MWGQRPRARTHTGAHTGAATHGRRAERAARTVSTATRPHAPTRTRKAGKQDRPRGDGGLKSPPLTRYRQAHTGTAAHAGGRRQSAGGTTATASRASSRDSERSEHGHAPTRPHAHARTHTRAGRQAQRAAGTASRASRYKGALYIGAMRHMYAIYSVK